MQELLETPMQFSGWRIATQWEAKLIGEVPILGYVIERLTVDYPHTKYDYSGLSLMDVSNVVVKVYHLCRV